MSKKRVAVIGCGRISVMHFYALTLEARVELVACCDIVRERAVTACEKYGGKPYNDYKKMIAEERLDAVHVCLPHYLHTVVSRYALENGVNVLCEKPMSIDYNSAEETVKLAEEKGLLYGIVFQCRFNESFKFVKNAVENGTLGKVKMAKSVLTWARSDDYYKSSDWKGTWDKEGGGVVIDQAIHSIDMVNNLIGDDAESVQCSMFNRNHRAIKVEDTAEGLITYKNGAKYSFYCMNNFIVDDPIEITVICEKGKAVFDYDKARIEYDDGRIETVTDESEDRSFAEGKNYWGMKHVNQVSDFYNALIDGAKLKISGKDALKTQKIVCEIYNAGKKYLV